MNRRGNILIFALLGLAVAALVGLCYEPLLTRPCGCRASLVDRGFSEWKPHDCAAGPMIVDLHGFHHDLEKVPTHDRSARQRRGAGAYDFVAARADNGWQISVDRYASVSDTPDLPGWYLLTADGRLHFSEKEPATAKDLVLTNLPLE